MSKGTQPQLGAPRKRMVMRCMALGALFTVAICVWSYLRGQSSKVWQESGIGYDTAKGEITSQSPSPKNCPSALPPPAMPPVDVNLWASLTPTEIMIVNEWLFEPSRDLNLTAGDHAVLSDNLVFRIEAYRPSKASALAYLSSPSWENLPDRFAKVTIHHGARNDQDGGPVIREYLVGPLDVREDMTIKRLTEIYHREEIPFNARAYTKPAELAPFLASIMTPLAEVTLDLFGGVFLGLPNDTLASAGSGPLSFDGSFRRTWFSWRRNVAGSWLHPVGFYLYVDVSGTDPDQWKLLKIVYNHQIFSSAESFLQAYHSNTLQRLPSFSGKMNDTVWATRHRPKYLAARDLDHLPGPRQVSFAGLRFRVDADLQYVSWMGWGMYLGFDRDMGLSLWDLRFLGGRIIYELSPQEALSQYAGNDPMQATTAWLDRFFGMGSTVRGLIPGYDCPYESVYLPATIHSSVATLKRERAICVFEQDTGRPITRHTGFVEGEYGAVRGYVLTIRSISTVGNYDYLFDYIFHTDGTIEVRVSASGYLQSTFWEASQAAYGTPIREHTMGSLHDHVINFKVDLDVAGTDNSLLYTHTVQEEVIHPWLDDDWGQTVIQQRIVHEYIQDENKALLKFPENHRGGYAIVNQAEPNRWGVPRGYAIRPGYSPIYNTVVGSKRLLHNANWARYNLAISRRKDTEPSSSSTWNLNLPGTPMVDFHKFFNGENITQQDLVAWINVGMHHLPQAEDVPNTRANIATSSFFLTPLNYFDSDVSIDSTNAILINASTEGAPSSIDEYGVAAVQCMPEMVPPYHNIKLKAFALDYGEPAPVPVPAATGGGLGRLGELRDVQDDG